jgi:cytoskeletal protein CcmA (bactofilin family)
MGIFSAENKPHTPGAVDTIIGEKAKFKGEVTSSGSLSINGEFDGKLVAQGEVIIGTASKVTGTVHAGSVVVSGKVEGNITATHSLEITKSGKVQGDLTGGRIVIEDGASYRGRVQVTAEGETVEPV